MTRRFALALALLGLPALALADMFTFFEDHFDGGTLNPAWIVWGSGPYSLVGSDLEFMTEQGDFHNAFEPIYGVPRHVFLIDPPDEFTQWTAVTRVRYNTPDEYHEQVDLIAFEDHDNSVKVSYNFRVSPPRYEHVVLSEQGGAVNQTAYNADPGYTDYFWLRLDRDGATYTAWASGDATADPDVVSWTLLGNKVNSLSNPTIGIGGWNSYATPTGELAEFDYFRLQIVPEPATATLLAVSGGLLMRRRRA